MVIFNPKQANFLFKRGVEIVKIVEGKNNDLGVMFNDSDKNLKPMLDLWKSIKDKEKKLRENL